MQAPLFPFCTPCSKRVRMKATLLGFIGLYPIPRLPWKGTIRPFPVSFCNAWLYVVLQFDSRSCPLEVGIWKEQCLCLSGKDCGVYSYIYLGWEGLQVLLGCGVQLLDLVVMLGTSVSRTDFVHPRKFLRQCARVEVMILSLEPFCLWKAACPGTAQDTASQICWLKLKGLSADRKRPLTERQTLRIFGEVKSSTRIQS